MLLMPWNWTKQVPHGTENWTAHSRRDNGREENILCCHCHNMVDTKIGSSLNIGSGMSLPSLLLQITLLLHQGTPKQPLPCHQTIWSVVLSIGSFQRLTKATDELLALRQKSPTRSLKKPSGSHQAARVSLIVGHLPSCAEVRGSHQPNPNSRNVYDATIIIMLWPAIKMKSKMYLR